ncbi:hypothetical protein HRI_004061100 [Hibiscus trionum]|uniref:Uncharacterized protein n=1 Tax=Hibiscus trionum TaxID=183268 RepID=A0A9W7IZ43_HIBTR|nr:hypothetical protein HRI_004061100 [Hibiscus trionum]
MIEERCETNGRVRRNVKLTPNQRSRAFVASRYVMEKMVELQSTPVEEGAEPKSTDDIVDEVLSTRLGYIPGLGYGPKPNKKNSSANTINLEKRLKNKEEELNVYKSNFETIQTQMEAVRSVLLVAEIQVPSLQFPTPNDTTNSSSPESEPTKGLDRDSPNKLFH